VKSSPTDLVRAQPAQTHTEVPVDGTDVEEPRRKA
jgi:hypothetical protein